MSDWPSVFALLSASADVTDIVGERIGAHNSIEPAETRPYITHSIVGPSFEADLDGGSTVDRWPVQINCHSTDQAELRQLAKAVRAALESTCYVTSADDPGQDTTTGVYRFSYTFDFIL